ncbi:hypothetical protein PpBr36_00593 [Pyricularia pennisetigena]|uniref:hypothetical protein n=1 Tax=Pyricularia pennisetigena TaxID=1578925 RepID=UPI0011505BEB|nr:hypothetical protein PpBr36_00593 [Pyricularia pennisetigena]TLS29725.1 hypothetical protein PpBr36_00593 [Pyricularia pennisetigena]
MEPFSTVCGVLALVGQVFKTVNSIQEHVATYKAASDDVTDLINHLNTHGNILRIIQECLEKSLASPDPVYIAGIPREIASILVSCEQKLKNLEQKILRLGRSGKIFGFNYISKKDEIAKACRDIYNLTNTLHLAISVQRWSISLSSVDQPPSYEKIAKMTQIQRDTVLTPSQTTEEMSTAADSAVVLPENSFPLTLRKSSETQRYRGIAGQVEVTRKNRRTKWSYFDDGIADESIEYLVKLPLVPYQIALQFRRSSIMPLSYSLNVTHVIQTSTQLGKELSALFHPHEGEDDLRGLQILLSSRKISLYSMLHDDVLTGSTSNLLHLAINNRMPIMSKFLALNDRSGKCLESVSTKNLVMTYLPAESPSEIDNSEGEQVLSVVFKSARAELDRDFFQWISYVYPDPEQFGSILNHFLRHHEGDTSEWIGMAWARAVDNYINLGPVTAGYPPGFFARRVEAWTPILKKLVQLGVDVHGRYKASWGFSQGSAYFHLLNYQTCHKQVVDDVHEWLGMLEDCGVHLPTYLAREKQQLPEQWELVAGLKRGNIYSGRELKTIDYHGLAALVWTPMKDASNGALELLQEFEALRGSHVLPSFRFSFPLLPSQGKKDRQASNVQPVEQKMQLYNREEWPVQWTLVSVAEEAVRYKDEWPPEYSQRIQELLDKHNRRLERRWNKRAYHREADWGAARMPGGWVESK